VLTYISVGDPGVVPEALTCAAGANCLALSPIQQ
jgi:hypothetical protein